MSVVSSSNEPFVAFLQVLAQLFEMKLGLRNKDLELLEELIDELGVL
jgi:hypothetical protein